MRRAQVLFAALAAFVVIAGCSSSGRLLANEPAPVPAVPSRTPRAVALPDPRPVSLPHDDAPHQRLTEWWYYTGHLRTDEGARFGFEFVVFRAERGSFPVTWASHLALTDESAGTFAFDERSEIGQQVDLDRALSDGERDGFDLAISGGDSFASPGASGGTPSSSSTPRPTPRPIEPWRMSGSGGRDRLIAATDRFGLDLTLDAHGRPAALHDNDGYIDFGPGGGSYYYSRTRMDASGTVTVDGRPAVVEGLAWFDHQWGDFIAVGAGGWDWFAINLDDGTDITLSLVRDQNGGYQLVYGTMVRPDGTAAHLPREAFQVAVTDHWTSPRTGAVYPAGWHVTLPGEALTIELVPTVHEQELDTRGTTGVVYWEGSQRVTATRNGSALGGEAYVELTGYGPGTLATTELSPR